MNTPSKTRYALIAAAMGCTVLAASLARADDTELFVGEAVAAPPARPNILFILDTSGSMDTNVRSQPPYDPATVYAGACAAGRIYWARPNNRGVTTPPACNSDQWVSAASFRCAAGQRDIDAAGSVALAKAARWRADRTRWDTLNSSDHASNIECQADAGVHGPDAASPNKWAADGASGPWTSNEAARIDWGRGEAVTFYSSNYLNWRAIPPVNRTRLEIMQTVATTVLDNLANNVNVGLMRYSNDGGGSNDSDAEGGMVITAMGRIEDNREAMKAAINSWRAEGWTPLSETLYEATQYFRGQRVTYGLTSDRFTGLPNGDTPSVASSRRPDDQSLYLSPMTQDCQKNYIVYLTDGEPTQDNQANAAIQGLPNFQSIVGTAACDIEPNLQWNNSGRCTDDLAKWLHESDLQPSVAGTQNVTSYWIGFGDEVRGSALLQEAAQRGGGRFYEAADTAELTEAFTEIISRILSQTASFTAPTVAVNAFNRTQNLNFLYMSVFKPSTSYRWLGNIKKYRITPAGVIQDAGGNAAVDPNTGFFYDSARSYWSDVVDGADAERGGAAGELTDPANRTVYANLTQNSGVLTEQLSDLKVVANLGLANNLLLGVVSAVPVAGRPPIDNIVDWAYGVDVLDRDGDADVTEARADMGDPLHSRPATVIYGGPEDNPDITLYATTNDGFLQAIDARTGNEIWSFVPRQMLQRLEPLYNNNDVASRVYGLDGAVKVVRLDRNNNGTIEPNGTDIDNSGSIEEDEKDKVFLFFGMRRGGNSIIGLNVTDRDAPRLMWTIGPSTLTGVGQTWSAPTVARVNVNRAWGASNPDKLVLIFGGGYDPAQDAISYVADNVGNRVFMVDAVTGALIWRAGPSTDGGAQLRLAKMTNSIPADIRVVDITGDGFADRMYAADMGGRVWRFDIRNGQTPSNLVMGGVFASLGTGDLAVKVGAAADASNRRFFYAPDVALMKVGTTSWINVAIGSGHREKPVSDETTVNRFYSLRDYNIFAQVANGQYKALCGAAEPSPCHQIITDDDARLLDVTADLNPVIPVGGVGWKMDLQDDGEKVLSESRTFQNRLYITTYSPQQREYNPEFCVATVGLNRLYVVDAATARPVVNFDTATDGVSSLSDRSKELAQGSIAPEAIFVFPSPDDGAEDPRVPPLCLVGLESCGSGLENPPVRTYWQQRGTN